MCTGDNLKTAVCVGWDCSMIPDNASLYLVSAQLGEDGNLAVQYTQQVGGEIGLNIGYTSRFAVEHFTARIRTSPVSLGF